MSHSPGMAEPHRRARDAPCAWVSLLGTNPLSLRTGGKASSPWRAQLCSGVTSAPRQSLPRGPSTSRGHCRGERPERASALPGPTLPPAYSSTVLLPVRDAGTHPGTGAGRMRSPPSIPLRSRSLSPLGGSRKPQRWLFQHKLFQNSVILATRERVPRRKTCRFHPRTLHPALPCCLGSFTGHEVTLCPP